MTLQTAKLFTVKTIPSDVISDYVSVSTIKLLISITFTDSEHALMVWSPGGSFAVILPNSIFRPIYPLDIYLTGPLPQGARGKHKILGTIPQLL